MSLKSSSRWLVGLGALVLAGCAIERPTINRVQPNALSKSFFLGELADPKDDPVFLFRNFVVDASESQDLVGISSASGVERIRWEVTESTLFARRAYSLTSGSNRGTSDEPNGDLVAAYRIESHFDLRNAYNPATGEELNIQEENTVDRPWYARDHFRVDWSRNLVESPVWTTMFFGTVFGGIKLTPLVYYQSDETSDDAPHIDAEAGYLDVTSHFLLEPEKTRWGNFELPLCWLMGLFTGSAIYSCDPQEAVVRTSFWRLDKADPDDDFEPFENTPSPQDIFGNPGGLGDSASHGITPAPLETYDPQYGFTDEGMKRLMLRHDLWKQSHQTRGSCETNSQCKKITGRDGSICLDSGTCSIPCSYEARSDGDRNGTDDQCENERTGYGGREGSQCSLRNRCTIPYRDRELDKVTYYVDPDMPDDLQDQVNSKGKVTRRGANEDLMGTWNQALQQAVAAAREVECRRTAGDTGNETRQRCHEAYFEVDDDGRDRLQMVEYGGWGLPTPKKLGDVLVLCHNPVRAYDDKACGPEGTRYRQGDIRANMLIYWNYNTQAPYGGIGAWRADPATGQIVGAAATTIGRSATQSAARVRDLLMVATGDLNLDDITGGVPATLFQRTLREGRIPEAFTNEQLTDNLKNIDHEHLRQSVSLNLSSIDPRNPGPGITSFRNSLVPEAAQAGKELLRYQAAAKPLLGTEFEAGMVGNTWVFDAVGANPASSITAELLDLTSPLRSYDMGSLAAGDQRFLRALGQRGVCHIDHATSVGTPDIAGLGRYYRSKYPELSKTEFADRVYEELWVEVYKGIQLHEIGHSLGLLHNFTSSWDSVNYNPQYWQLRTHEGTSTASCNGFVRSPGSSVSQDTCMGPRYLDPDTDDELGLDSEPRPGLNYYAHTSTMEYQNARFFETVGLGQYDVMAMKALYGGVLETMDSREFPLPDQAAFLSLNETQRSEDWPVYNQEFGFPVPIHYTELARRLKLFDAERCRPATEEEKVKAEWRIVHGKVCAPPSKDHAHWDDFQDSTGDGPTATTARKVRVSPDAPTSAQGATRWPYRFGGDMSNAYMHVNPFDSGSDAYEVTMETIRKNSYNYPLNYFRAKRRGWTDLHLPASTARQFYERLRSYHWGISFASAFYGELVEQVPALGGIIDEWRNSDDVMRPGLLAQLEMFNGIAAVLMAPEPGQYFQQSPNGRFFDINTRGISNTAQQFTLDASLGRFLAPAYDSGPQAGGSWDYTTYAQRSGYEIEKALAGRALTDGRPVFSSFSRDIYLDDRITNINFRNDVPKAVDRLLGGLLAAQWPSVSPYVTSTDLDRGDAELKVPDLLSEAPALPNGAQQLFPNFGYNQAVPTLVYSHLYGRLNGDLELSNKLRIWVQGSISREIELPEAEQIRFTNPESGITYVARRYGNETVLGVEVDRGIGSRMLSTANQMLLDVYEAATDEDGQLVYNQFGQPELARDDAGQLVPRQAATRAASQTKLRRYVGQLDATVQISNLVGYGPFNAD